MTFSFKQARREGVHLIIGLIGGTGSGKTFSAFALAEALSGGKRFAVIDTEAGRALHYADQFSFDHGDLQAPFRPSRYLEAIVAADEAGYPVIIVDSMSHEHAGEGGLLDWHDDEMHGNDARKLVAWIKPKMAHKHMVQGLLQLRAHLILCFRAEEKTKVYKDPKTGKQVIESAGWQPVCAKGLEFEMTCSFLLTHEQPGKPTQPIKLPEQLRQYFPPDQFIGGAAGRGLAAWAAGDDTPTFTQRIQKAASLEELQSLADDAKHLPDVEREDAKHAWRTRKQQLSMDSLHGSDREPAMGVV